jgi:hypothetical protein
MADGDVRYETRTVQTVRGLEARTRAKWERDGWEFVEQTNGALRSALTFRRVKKPIPRWALIAGVALALAIVIGIIVGSLTEGDTAPAPSTSAEAAAPSTPAESASTEPSATASSSAAAETSPVTDAEVLATFNDYFAERASKNVVIAKAISEVTFSNGVLHVTFDPAHAGISQDLFDQINPYPNGDMGRFVASPIAFNDPTGNRIRPAVQSIVTTEADGTSLGTLDHAGILALNGLSQ